MRILIAENDRDLRELMAEVLEGAGHEVVAVANGTEALAILPESDAPGFDLLLTDVAMPVVSGLELARRVVLRWPDLPILYVTGRAPETLLRNSSAVQAPVLCKPFRLAALLIAVERGVTGDFGDGRGRPTRG